MRTDFFTRSAFACGLAIFFTALAIAPTVCSGQEIPRVSDVKKDARYGALTWMQHSAEYKLLTKQIYRLALTQLSVGLQDATWSADEVQQKEGGYEDKQPAIILDVDETVLDNSPFNARNVAHGLTYSRDSWNAWCNEAQAKPIPGALEFVTASTGMGVEVFFVTNREDVVKAATLKNLKALGFPVDAEHLLMKNAEAGRDRDKVSRREMVAQDHRIVLLIGDNLSDLFSGMDVPNTLRRNEVAMEKCGMLGSRWIVLPNPVYGGWERALPEGKKALRLDKSDE